MQRGLQTEQAPMSGTFGQADRAGLLENERILCLAQLALHVRDLFRQLANRNGGVVHLTSLYATLLQLFDKSSGSWSRRIGRAGAEGGSQVRSARLRQELG